MVDVISADGKMTKGDDPDLHSWTSEEDFAHFMELIHQHRVIVMGSKTYDAARPKPQAERLRIVLTSDPGRYATQAVPGSLEFVTETPQAVVERLTGMGHDALLLVGGGQTNAEFLQAHLVDELYLTIEPVVFGRGVDLLGGIACDAKLQLLSVKQLNSRGTLLVRYRLAPTAAA
jgi:dihydrofolate reductase